MLWNQMFVRHGIPEEFILDLKYCSPFPEISEILKQVECERIAL